MIPRQPIPADSPPLDAECLWAVWSSSDPVQASCGEPPVQFSWILASPGEQGAAEIAGPRGYPTRLLAALPLSAFRNMDLVLGTGFNTSMPRWARAVLGNHSIQFSLVRDGEAGVRLAQKGDPSATDHNTLFKGTSEDFFRLLEEGNQILKNGEFDKVSGDVRPKNGSTFTWLERQQAPAACDLLEKFLAETV